MLGMFKSGPAPAGTWGEQARFGRLEGTGEVGGEVELPAAEEVLISVEDYRMIDELEVELTGPDGSAVPLERHRQMSKHGSRNARHNLHRLAHGKPSVAGTHRLTVRAPDANRALIVVVGKDFGPADALRAFGA
jgi:Proprotein convertase P-domain